MDHGILEDLYHQHFNRIYRTAYLITGDHQMAEDATQEAFLKAFAKLDTLREMEKFASWVTVIASNYAIDLLRKRKKMVFSDKVSYYIDENPGIGISPQESWEKAEMRREVWEALYLLEPEEREILVLKYFNEMSIKEISSITDTPAGTIKSRLFRARQKIKNLLQPDKKKKRPLNKIQAKL